MFGVPPRLDPSDNASLLINATDEHRRYELLAAASLRAHRRDVQLSQTLSDAGSAVRKFSVRDWVLVGHGQAYTSTVKWSALKSRYYGPCRVWKAEHPRYWLVSYGGRYKRRPVHARSLVIFTQRPTHLLHI